MRNLLIFVLLFVAASVVRADETWPQKYLRVDGTSHTLVVLYADGTAAFSSRTTRPESDDWHFAASNASWEWCDLKGQYEDRRCVHLFVEGLGDVKQQSVRLDYWYEASQIVEFDKTGIQETLIRIDTGDDD